MIPTHRPPTHAGEILLEEFLKPLKLTQVEAAEKMGMSQNRLNELIRGKRGVTADTALRLAKLLKTTPEFWLNLQTAYNLIRSETRGRCVTRSTHDCRHLRPEVHRARPTLPKTRSRVTRQVDGAKAFIAAKGWTLDGQHVYTRSTPSCSTTSTASAATRG